jgi:hypothetical protein
MHMSLPEAVMAGLRGELDEGKNYVNVGFPIPPPCGEGGARSATGGG